MARILIATRQGVWVQSEGPVICSPEGDPNGIGLSMLVDYTQGGLSICITPSLQEVEQIKAWCERVLGS